MRRGFTIHHNGPPVRCVGQPHERCVSFWAAVRRYHIETKGWSDIAYSFGVCPHGVRFVGRGWNLNQWANGRDMVGSNDGTDADWYTVLVFVGGDVSTGDEEPPTAEMIQATADLIAEGRATRRCGTQVLPHNAFKVKKCPGSAFTALANEWHNAPLPTEEDDMTPEQAAQLESVEAMVKRLIASNTRIENKPLRPTVAAIVAADDIDVDALADEITERVTADLLAKVQDAVRAALPSDLADEVIDALTARLSVAAEELG